MKNSKIFFTAMLLSMSMLIPSTFYAQGKGKGKDHNEKENHGNNGGKIKFKSKGGGDDLKINIKIGDKGKGNDGIKIITKNGNDHFGHPGKGHAYGKYKWNPSKDVVHARTRYRDQLSITISLLRVIEVFLSGAGERHNSSRMKFDLAVKNGKIDIKVKERRAARLAHIDIKIKELDNLNKKAKLKVKIG